MDQQQQIQQAMHIWATMFPVILLFWLIKITLYVIPMWRIARRAGLSAPMALLCAIPLIGRLVTLYAIAFADWKVAPLAAFPYPPAYPAATPYPAPPTTYSQATYATATPPAPAPPSSSGDVPPDVPSV